MVTTARKQSKEKPVYASPEEAGDVEEQARTAVRLAKAGGIPRQEALLRVNAASLPELLHPRVDPGASKDYEILGRGFAASPGAAAGRAGLSAEEIQQGEESLVLVIESLSPEGKEGLPEAVAVVTGTTVLAVTTSSCCVAWVFPS